MLIKINLIDEESNGKVNFTVINAKKISHYVVHDTQVMIYYQSHGHSKFGFPANDQAATFALALNEIMLGKISDRKSGYFRITVL